MTGDRLNTLFRRAILFAAWTLPVIVAAEVDPAADREVAIYEQRAPTRDGIGKFYLGREISHVMGHQGAAWLERPGRQREEGTGLLIERLPLQADSVVADIGAGTGYFSFAVAQRVPDAEIGHCRA